MTDNGQSRDPSQLIVPPGQNTGEKGLAVARGVAGAIPYAGTAVGELMTAVFGAPLTRRRAEWEQQVSEAINELREQHGKTIEMLQNNARFVSIAATASQIALRTHQAEKREALRNSLLNSAVTETVDEALQNQFLHYVDIFSVWHIRILRYFSIERSIEQNGRYQRTSSSLGDAIEDAFPEFKSHREIYDAYWNDLYSRGLVNTSHLHATMTVEGTGAKRTTALGDMFIQSISGPTPRT